MIKRIFLYLFLLSGYVAGVSGQGCDCENFLSEEVALEQADLVFVGKVVFVNTNWMSGGWKFSFEVEKTWKRQASNFLIINTGYEKDCGYLFDEGKRYLVHVKKTFGLKTDACMGNKPIEEATAELKVLGEGFSPQQGSGNSGQSMFLAILLIVLVLSSMGFLAFVVLRNRSKIS